MFLRVSNPYCFTFICLICRAMAERCPYYQPVTSECPPAHQTLAPSHWPGLLSHRGTSNKKTASRKVEHSALCVCIGHSLLKDLKDPFLPAATVPEDTKPGCSIHGCNQSCNSSQLTTSPQRSKYTSVEAPIQKLTSSSPWLGSLP